MRDLVYMASRGKVDVDMFHKGIPYVLEKTGKKQQYQILKAKDTRAPGTSLLIIPELHVLVLTKRHVGSGNEIVCTITGNRDGWVHTVTNGNTVEFPLMATHLQRPPFLSCGRSIHSIFFLATLQWPLLCNSKSVPKALLSQTSKLLSTMAN